MSWLPKDIKLRVMQSFDIIPIAFSFPFWSRFFQMMLLILSVLHSVTKKKCSPEEANLVDYCNWRHMELNKGRSSGSTRRGESWGSEVPSFCCWLLIFSLVNISTDNLETYRIYRYNSKEQVGIFAEFSVDSLLQNWFSCSKKRDLKIYRIL